MSERRVAERFRVKFKARWEGVLSQREGLISDISSTGCFLLTRDDVTPKELVRIEIQLPPDRWIYFWAEVVYQIPEMGFALRFTGTTDAEQQMLEEMLDAMARGAAA